MDWNSLITQLEGAGLTQKEIADQVGCSQPFVSQLKNGQRRGPDFEIGRALESLHKAKRPDLYPSQEQAAA